MADDVADCSAVAVVQARMSSTRLPGKVLADVCGEPLLALLLARLARSATVAKTVVATSTQAEDDPIEAVARSAGCAVHRGPLEDVLARFVGAIGDHDGPVVRVTGDCPLVDPRVVDEVVELYERCDGCVYASNVFPRAHPDGLDVEVVAAAALRTVARESRTASDREHVTSAIRAQPERFQSASLPGDASLGPLRWTVDTPADLEFVRKLVGRLGTLRYQASVGEILAAVRAPPSLARFEGVRG